MQEMIILDGNSLTVRDLLAIARDKVQVDISPYAISWVEDAYKVVQDAVSKHKTIYGLTTGFGSFENKRISKHEIIKLQENILKSHAVGTGDPLSPVIVRAIIALRLNTFLKGHSGVSLDLIKALQDMLNSDIVPWVPSKGSVGSSGDLCPMAHIGLVLMGLGRAYTGIKGEALIGIKHPSNLTPVSGELALKEAGLKPYSFKAKEGLAITNGTTAMTAILALAVEEAERLMVIAQAVSSLSLEGFLALPSPFFDEVSRVRGHKGQIRIASNLRRLTEGSKYIGSGDLASISKDGLKELSVEEMQRYRVQDSYSIRCIPTVLGASLDALEYVKGIVEIELNAATDNPLIFPDTGDVVSACNFHGQPLAICSDFLALAISEIGSISERRLAKLLDSKNNYGLLAYLIHAGGLNSGFMIAQYTAAALASENKVYCHPASADSIPTSANQEDHVSMGNFAVRKLLTVIENTWAIIALEYLASAQAVDLRGGSASLSPATGIIYNKLRERIFFLEEDRELYIDLEACIDIVRGFGEDSLLSKMNVILEVEV